MSSALNFASLINELDEALFNDCGCFDTFWVQDNEYKLESLYYKQESWSDDVAHQNVQPFAFSNACTITLDEGMFLIMICDKWMHCLETAHTISDSKKLASTVFRYQRKVDACLQSVIEHMMHTCLDEEQLGFIKQLKDTRVQQILQKKLKTT